MFFALVGVGKNQQVSMDRKYFFANATSGRLPETPRLFAVNVRRCSMSRLFEELDFRPTSIGTVSLRRRFEPKLNRDVLEIKLGEEFLMSSLFTESEVALAKLGLDCLTGGDLDVVVGGLGLGYTAKAVLDNPDVRSLIVVDALEPIIEWHESGLLPLGPSITGDSRCRLQLGDFFELAASDTGFDAKQPRRAFDAILVDIDHSPEALLDENSASFYQPPGLAKLAGHLKPGGVFGLWSNDRPDDRFTDRLAGVFGDARAEAVTFHNPMQEREATQTVYIAVRAAPAS